MPNSVVLFDQVEKAHISVLNRFGLMLDEGRLRDTHDYSMVDFTQTIIIMTSNIGSKYLLTGLSGKTSMDNARSKVMEEVRLL